MGPIPFGPHFINSWLHKSLSHQQPVIYKVIITTKQEQPYVQHMFNYVLNFFGKINSAENETIFNSIPT